MSLYGIIHSHPVNCTRLSYADKQYAQKFMENNEMDSTILFIAMSTYDSVSFSIAGFKVLRENVLTSVEEVNITIRK